MSDINSVVIEGTVSKAAVYSTTNSGFALAKGEIECARTYRGRDGQQGSRSSWIAFAVVGDRAQEAAGVLFVGRRVLLQGQLVQDRWKDKISGVWQHQTRVEARDYEVLGGAAATAPAAPAAAPAPPPPPRPQYSQPPLPPPQGYVQTPRQAPPDQGVGPDDTPF